MAHRTLYQLSILAIFIILVIFLYPARLTPSPSSNALSSPSPQPQTPESNYAVDASLLDGKAIATKLGNETLKAELGRAAWRLLHTTFARFPDRPTAAESAALRSYIHLFQKLYPCGECAAHFGEVLQKYPPQVSSRSAAAVWGCHVHNVVNEKLGKAVFDCAKIGDFYDCGCAEEEGVEGKG